MVFFAFVLAKMNAVADWFVKMRITAPADGINRLLNYFPLALVVVLFFFVLYVDQALKAARREKSMTTRSGIGYDLHRLAEGRKLMIGGIEVPFDKGSVGHSDGDVLAHALPRSPAQSAPE